MALDSKIFLNYSAATQRQYFMFFVTEQLTQLPPFQMPHPSHSHRWLLGISIRDQMEEAEP